MNISVIALLSVALIVSSCTDILRREIPLWIFPGVLIVYIVIKYLNTESISKDNIFGFFIMFIPFLILCVMDKMGGGDLIMFSTIGFILGIEELYPYMISLSVISTAFFITKKEAIREEIPIAPFAAAAYFLYLSYKAGYQIAG